MFQVNDDLRDTGLSAGINLADHQGGTDRRADYRGPLLGTLELQLEHEERPKSAARVEWRTGTSESHHRLERV